jgi:hypothetical protein
MVKANRYFKWVFIFILICIIIVSYAYNNRDIILKPIKKIDISQSFYKKIHNNIIQFHFSNTSIIEMPNKKNFYGLNVRCINYKIVNGKQINKNDKSISLNKLLFLDNNFNLYDDEIFDDNLKVNKEYVGIEDVRLYEYKGELHYSGSYYDVSSNTIKISNNKYIITNEKLLLTPNIIQVDFKTKYDIEKNWAYFDYNNDKYIVYQWYPLKICNIINNRLKEIETKEMPPEFEKFRGSSPGVIYKNNIWFIVHVRNNNYYHHHFVCFDKSMNLIKYSEPFHFEQYGIEFTLSFIIRDDIIIIPYTVNDTKLIIGVYDTNYIINEIQYTTVN